MTFSGHCPTCLFVHVFLTGVQPTKVLGRISPESRNFCHIYDGGAGDIKTLTNHCNYSFVVIMSVLNTSYSYEGVRLS